MGVVSQFNCLGGGNPQETVYVLRDIVLLVDSDGFVDPAIINKEFTKLKKVGGKVLLEVPDDYVQSQVYYSGVENFMQGYGGDEETSPNKKRRFYAACVDNKLQIVALASYLGQHISSDLDYSNAILGNASVIKHIQKDGFVDTWQKTKGKKVVTKRQLLDMCRELNDKRMQQDGMPSADDISEATRDF